MSARKSFVPFQFEMPRQLTGGAHRAAIRSDDRAYVHMISAMDDVGAPYVNVILAFPLPGGALEPLDDPRLLDLKARARRLGYGGVVATYVFGMIAQDPTALARRRAAGGDVVGIPKNDEAIFAFARNAGFVLAAWGDECELVLGGRTRRVFDIVASAGMPVHALAVSMLGGPYLPDSAGAPAFVLSSR